MGLLDRFRAQPRWKHSSPAIRLAAVEELPLDQQDILVAIAREDRDAGVRIAAVRKVLAPSVVADIAASDGEARVREEATGLLVDLACGEFEGTEVAESLAALSGLSDPKHILAVARGAAAEGVARAALTRLTDAGALGSVARRSTHGAVRLEALGRIADETELTAVAIRSEYKDVTAAAVERLSSRDRLEEIAARGKNKTAAKRARARVREIDEAEAAAAAKVKAAPVPTSEEVQATERRRRAADWCRRLEAQVGGDLDEAEASLAEAERVWTGLAIEDEALAARFAAATAAVRDAMSAHMADRAERTRRALATADAVAARRALCETVDGVAGEDAPARLDEARTAFAALPECPDEAEAARWTRRFTDALRAAEARHRSLLAQRARREQATRVCAGIEELAASADLPRGREVQAIRRAWNELTASGFDDAALAARFKAAEETLQSREGEARAQREREQQETLTRLQALCAEAEAAAAAPDLTLKSGEKILRDVRAALDAAVPLPTRQDHEQVTERLQAAMAVMFPRVQQLRDMDDWQRWANAGVQEELCRQVEQLVAVEDLAAAARQLREAQARWKAVATAPRDQSQALWNRFKAASDAVRAKCDVYFAQVATDQAANQARKEALCQQAEALSLSTDWIKTAEAIKAIQAEWKGVGPAPRAQEKALWDRFHAACDAFFTRRREDLGKRKEEWAANLARKEAICEQAETIAGTTEWQKGVEEIKRLQAEWKTIGPVRKARADAIWQRFRAACDRFFERYQQRDQLAVSAVVADAEGVVQEFEALLPAQGVPASAEGGEASAPDGGGAVPDPPEDLAAKTADMRARWLAVAASLPRERALRLGDRYTRAVTRLVEAWPASFAGTDWDPEANLRRMEELCVQVEQLLAPETSQGTGAPVVEDESPASLLARQLREALATNTIAGKTDDSPRLKAASEDLRAAQAAWRKIGPVPEAASRALNARFQKACTRASEKIDQRRRGLAAR
jgi:hypothetical protein